MNVDFDATVGIGIANKSVIISDNVFFQKNKKKLFTMSCCSFTTNRVTVGNINTFIENLASEDDELLVSKLATLNEDSLKFRVTYILIK